MYLLKKDLVVSLCYRCFSLRYTYLYLFEKQQLKPAHNAFTLLKIEEFTFNH